MLTEKEGVCWFPEEEIDRKMRGMEGLTFSQACGLILSPLEGGAGKKPRVLCLRMLHETLHGSSAASGPRDKIIQNWESLPHARVASVGRMAEPLS